MAKLGIYYGLCPLIDQKSLLGVSEDKQNGCVIVTLGKNMAIKYKLSDQKQLHSWSTKEKLTSPVIYDPKNDKYVAIFNNNYLKVWGTDETDLDKVKKFKFSTPLHTILEGKDEPILVFKNCYGFKLSSALEHRKDIPNSDLATKYISSTSFCYENKEYVGSMVRDKNIYKFICTITDEISQDPIVTFDIVREKFKLIGHVVMESDNGPILYTLWSDGRLFSYPIFTTAYIAPGNFYSIIETLSRQNEICMVALSKNYLAIYGADINQEGASLQLYNTQFKVPQSKLGFKFFSEGSQLWNIGNTLLLTVGQNLAVIPYSLATEQLAALVGSHKMVATNDDDLAIVTEVLVENWGESFDDKVDSTNLKISPKLKNEVMSLTNEGWSEFAICDFIFPKLMEKKDTKSILELLDYFLDIPDLILVNLISYCISTNLSKIQNGFQDGGPKSFTNLINKLLATPYNDSILMPHLRTKLSFDEVLILLQYLTHFLINEITPLSDLSLTDSESKVIDWACLLIDSHYQKFLLLKDPKLLEILTNLKNLIDQYYSCLQEYKTAEPIVSKLKRGKSEVKMSGNDFYTIEKIKLY